MFVIFVQRGAKLYYNPISRMKIKPFLSGIFLVIIFFVAIPLCLISINNFFNLPVFSHLYLKIIGSIFFLIGFLLVSYFTTIHMRTGRSTALPVIDKPKKFIVSGLYKYCRNPMYLADLLIFIGGFLLLGHILLLFYIVLAFPVIHLFVVYIEEPELKKIFGKQYDEYTKKIPRWIPKL